MGRKVLVTSLNDQIRTKILYNVSVAVKNKIFHFFIKVLIFQVSDTGISLHVMI